MRPDPTVGENQPDRPARATQLDGNGDAGPIDEAESQMRKALGLLGEGQRHRFDQDRAEQPSRLGDRVTNGFHRRRFVQDGDIPVTVLRRDQSHEVTPHRGVAAPPLPSNSRLQRTEAALAAETAAREKAERTLIEVQTLARDLQTKIGHAELAKNEAVDALRRERDVIVQLRADAEAHEQRLQDALRQASDAEEAAASYQERLEEERQARKALDKALKSAEVARDAAEQRVQMAAEAPTPARTTSASRLQAPAKAATAPAARPKRAFLSAVEPEPVKWWLSPTPAPKRR